MQITQESKAQRRVTFALIFILENVFGITSHSYEKDGGVREPEFDHQRVYGVAWEGAVTHPYELIKTRQQMGGGSSMAQQMGTLEYLDGRR